MSDFTRQPRASRRRLLVRLMGVAMAMPCAFATGAVFEGLGESVAAEELNQVAAVRGEQLLRRIPRERAAHTAHDSASCPTAGRAAARPVHLTDRSHALRDLRNGIGANLLR